MKTLSFICQKGGTGKTTLALNIAVEGLRRGLGVAVIDLDPQPSACAWADLRNGDGDVMVLDAKPSRLGAAVAAAESLGGLDLLIIDTGGRTEEGAFAAAKVSDLVVMPVQPSAVDLKSVPATCDLITMAGNPLIVAVLTREKPFGARHEETRAWLGAARIPVAQTSLGDRVTFQDAYAAGLGVGEFAPSSKAAQEIEKLFNEIAEQVGMQTIQHAGKTTCRGVAHGGQKTQSRRAG